MGLKLPPAIAGDDNEVSADSDGIMNIVRLIGGVALAAMIVGAGLWLKSRVASAAGADEQTDLGITVA